MRIGVDGRVALVTGASRGIGEAVVRHLLDAGVVGVVVTGRKAETLEPLAADLGDRVVPVVGNVADPDHAEAAVATAVDRFGSCDLLVNNAGTNPGAGPLMDVQMGAVDKTWEINLRAPLVWSRAAWHGSMRERGGAIVNIGSVGGLRPSPVIGAYNVSKAGLHHLTHQLALELAPDVRVNAVAAAVVKTRLSRLLWSADEEAAAKAHPLQRLGTPDDVARAVLFLLSDASSWITGVVLPVDGGATGASAGLPG
ncbi:SDR family oxidoreductase [Egicoccus sp. AB-alg2]|uniref:SDR family oxidoreductase n=1 Tax=Egicoccus sp. AB-alg2 TaxID=3242693 RepID=UPI00359D0B48